MTVQLTDADIARFRLMVEEADIRRLIAGYADAIDWIDWARLETMIWPDAVFDFGMFKGERAAFMGFVRQLEEGYRRRLHLFGDPAIVVDGDAARVDVTTVIACLTDDDAHGYDQHFWGRYVISLAKRDGVWKISALSYIHNLLQQQARTADDRTAPLNFGDGMTPTHPLARVSRMNA